MNSDFKIFLNMLLRQLNFIVLSVEQPFYVYKKKYKGQITLILWFLSLPSESGLILECSLEICHPRASCL